MAMPIISGYVTYGVLPAITQATGDTAHPITFNPTAPTHTGVLSGSAISTNQWMVVVLMAGSTLSGTQVPALPSGWTELVPFAQIGTGTSCFGVWAKQRLSGETTYSTTVNADTGRGAVAYYRTLWFSDALSVADWLTGTFAIRASNATTTTTVAPAVTTNHPDSLVLHLSGERTVAAETDAQVTVSAGFTKDLFNNSADGSLTVSHALVSTSGTVIGPVTTTYPNTHTNNGIAGLIVIPGAAPSPSGLSIKISNGSSLDTAYLKVSNGGGSLVTPGGLKVVKPGYSSVSAMLASSPFYIAHRGGSRDFPEMSLYAYGQSVLRGYGALELSLARTSDGVWFGLHDADINRTSGTTGLSAASTMTWAQIQSYQILGSVAANNPTQSSRPYMRLEEILKLYYPSHVIFIDVKYAVSYVHELIGVLNALPGTPSDHFVGKSYGVTSPTFANAFHGSNYKTWGYYYQSDVPSLASTQGMWDILGMDYGANAASWTAVTSYSKPVIGHICPTVAAKNTAIGLGASGLMCSGAVAIVPNTPYNN